MAVLLLFAGTARADDLSAMSAAQLAKACEDLEGSAQLRSARAAVSAARMAERADADMVRIFAAAFEREAVRRLNESDLTATVALAWAEEHDKLLSFIPRHHRGALGPLQDPASDVSPSISWATVGNAVIRLLASPAAAPGWAPAEDSDPAVLRIRLQSDVVPRLIEGAPFRLETPPLPAAICGFYGGDHADVCGSMPSQVADGRALEEASQCEALGFLGDIVVARCPDRPEGYGLRADAHRCAKENWLAARQYKRYSELGGADTADLKAQVDVAHSLGRLTVQIQTDEAAGVPRARLRVADHEFRPDGGDGRRTFQFDLLPEGKDLMLHISGIGFDAVDVPLPTLRGGEAAVHEQPLPWLGEGRVRIDASSAAAPGEEWRLLTEHRELNARDGDGVRTTAGTGRVVLEVSNSEGTVRAPLDVSPGEELTVDPLDWTPAAVAIQGLPSGTSVRFRVDGTGGRSSILTELDVEGDDTNLLVGTDVPLVERSRVAPLIGGKGHFELWHPSLGGFEDSLIVVAGRTTPATVVGTRMSNHAAYKEAWRLHQEADLQRTIQRRSGIAGLAGGAAGAAALSGILAAAGVAANQQALDAKAAAIGEPISAAPALHDTYTSSIEQSQGLAVGAVVLGVTAGVLVGITIDFDAKTRRPIAFEPPKAEGAPDWAK